MASARRRSRADRVPVFTVERGAVLGRVSALAVAVVPCPALVTPGSRGPARLAIQKWGRLVLGVAADALLEGLVAHTLWSRWSHDFVEQKTLRIH